MNWNFAEAILPFAAIVIIPRFIVELASSRRVRAKAQASGKSPMSLVDRLRAQSVPWILFGVFGAAAAVAIIAISR